MRSRNCTQPQMPMYVQEEIAIPPVSINLFSTVLIATVFNAFLLQSLMNVGRP